MTWYYWLLILLGYGLFFWFICKFFQTVHEWDEEIKEMHKEKSDAQTTPHK